LFSLCTLRLCGEKQWQLAVAVKTQVLFGIICDLCLPACRQAGVSVVKSSGSWQWQLTPKGINPINPLNPCLPVGRR
jgi:hypothetical protein